MGYIWRLGTPRKEDREKLDRTPYTWADYAVKLFAMIINRHTHAKEFYIVNDRYDINESIKDAEHLRRAQSESCSKNAYPKNSALFPPANQVGSFFTNPANKMRLQRYLREMFMIECESKSIKMYYNSGSECIDLARKRSVHSLRCDQNEADTKMFFMLLFLALKIQFQRASSRIQMFTLSLLMLHMKY